MVREAQRFVTVHVDLSPGKDSQENKDALASYDQRGLPLVVLHDSKGEEAKRITSFVPPEDLLAMMQAVK